MDKDLMPAIEELISKLDEFEKEEAKKQVNYTFNIYDTIPRRHYEDIHNRMLYYLLNPREKHGCRNLFLDCFLEEIDHLLSKEHKPILNNLKTKGAYVLLEHHETNCGRVDVFITDNVNNHIIIENKINGAQDQATQLIRYRKKWKDSIILYLTKNGCKPSDTSIRKDNHHRMKEGADYYTISYSKQISSFLDKSYAELDEKVNKSAMIGIKSYVKHLNETLLKNTPIMDKTVDLLVDNYPELLKYINIDAIEKANYSIRERFINKLREELSLDKEWCFTDFDDKVFNQNEIVIATHSKLSQKLAKTEVVIGKFDSHLHYGIKDNGIPKYKAAEIEESFRRKSIIVENNGFWIDVCFEIEYENEKYDFWDNEVGYELINNMDKHLKKLKEDISSFVNVYKHMRLG